MSIGGSVILSRLFFPLLHLKKILILRDVVGIIFIISGCALIVIAELKKKETKDKKRKS